MAISALLRNISLNLVWQHILNPVSIISQILSSLSKPPPTPDNIISIVFRIRRSTTSSCPGSVASKRQCVTADDNICIATGSRGEDSVIIRYEKNFIMAVNASEVICPEVAEDRITAKNGASSDGKSNVVISPCQ